MTAYTGTFQLFTSAKKRLMDGTIDLDTHTFKAVLTTSAQALSIATAPFEDALYADLTAELATANGYTAGGAALTSVTLTESGGTVTWDSADITWTATGGNLVARYFAIYDDTATGDPLVGYGLLNSAGTDVTILNGEPFTIVVPVAGWLHY